MKKLLSIFLLIVLCAGCNNDDDTTTNPTLPPTASNFNEITITTNELTEIDLDDAFSRGTLSMALDAVAQANYHYGVCYSVTHLPEMSNTLGQAFSGDSSTGTYITKISNLVPNTVYYARAYITNGVTIKYGNEVTFFVPKIIETNRVGGITALDFGVANNVIATGNKVITSIGCCFSSAANPTTANDVSYASSNVRGEEISVKCTSPNLVPGQYYHVRGFVIIDGRTFYGQDLTFRMAGYIGPSGGLVFYDLGSSFNMFPNVPSSAWRYVEVAPSTIDNNGTNNYSWGCSGFYQSDLNFNFGQGYSNTLEIKNDCPFPYTAAYVCWNAVINGNTHWALPNIEELKVVYKLKQAGLLNITQNVWTSEQVNNSTAFAFSFSAGTTVNAGKDQQGPSPAILPIRFFN